MTISIGVVMDPIEAIKIHKDSTFAMMLEAQRRGWELWYMRQGDLFLDRGQSQARITSYNVCYTKLLRAPGPFRTGAGR